MHVMNFEVAAGSSSGNTGTHSYFLRILNFRSCESLHRSYEIPTYVLDQPC